MFGCLAPLAAYTSAWHTPRYVKRCKTARIVVVFLRKLCPLPSSHKPLDTCSFLGASNCVLSPSPVAYGQSLHLTQRAVIGLSRPAVQFRVTYGRSSKVSSGQNQPNPSMLAMSKTSQILAGGCLSSQTLYQIDILLDPALSIVGNTSRLKGINFNRLALSNILMCVRIVLLFYCMPPRSPVLAELKNTAMENVQAENR